MSAEKEYISVIAREVNISLKQVEVTINLFDEGCTTPFIARYRKEATGALDEVQVEAIRLIEIKLTALINRKLAILKVIEEQGQLSDLLSQKINDCWDINLLEDIYLPYKPKRKTKASVAREKGLEPLALWLMKETNFDVIINQYTKAIKH